MDGIKAILDLNLSMGGTEFIKELRCMDNEFIFSVPRLFNKTKGTRAQQDQQQEKQDSLQPS